MSINKTEDHLYNVWHPWTSMPHLIRESSFHINIERALGTYLYSRDNFRFIDGSAGLWNVSLGHGRTDIINAISEQLHKLTYLCNIELRSQIANDLAKLLLAQAPANMSCVMFHCTGTAAVEAAVLLVRQYFKLIGQPKRCEVISLDGAYHGCSLLGTTISGNPEESSWFEPLPPGFHHIPAPRDEETARKSVNTLSQLIETRGSENLAAFVFEPIMGVAGVVVPPDWWTTEVIGLCRQNGIKVIADEVTTAFGRVGSWFACEDQKVDAIALGKGISGGYIPLAATIYSQELFEPFNAGVNPESFKYGSTMDGYPAACAAGIAVIRALQNEGLVARAAQMSLRLTEQLKALEQLEIVGSIRGRGMMLGIPLLEPKGEKKPMGIEKCLQIIGRLTTVGVLIHPVDSATLAVLPPLTISEEESDELVAKLSDVLENANHRYNK